MSTHNSSRLIHYQFRLRQIQMEHPVLCPPLFNRPAQCLHILQKLNHLWLNTFGMPFQNLIGLLIGQPLCRTHYRICKAPRQNIPLVVIGYIHAFDEPLLLRLKRAYPVTQNLRQHRYCPARQINAVTANLRFRIQRRISRHKIAHICYMNSQHPVASRIFFHAYRIIKVFGIRRVNGNNNLFGNILSTTNLFTVKLSRRLTCLLDTIRVKFTRQMILTNYRLYLTYLLSRPAQHLDNYTAS
ncbi:hypothetical protein ES703_56274 [subsurface metagenome]